MRRDAARLASTRLPLVRAEADRQRAATADAAQLADDCAGVRDLRDQRETAREYANDLRETAQRIRQERIDGMIAELAAQLTDDTACPVCGSFDHPEPSEIRARRVTHHEEEQAYAEADAARDAVNKIDSELAIVGARMGDLIGRLMAADVDDTVLREDAALVEALAVTGSIAAVPSTVLPAGSRPAGSLPGEAPPAKRAPPAGLWSGAGLALIPGAVPPPAPPPSAGPLAASGFGRMPGADTVLRLNELAVTLAAAAETLEAEAVRLDAEAAQLSRYETDLTEMATTVAEQEKRHSALAEQREAALAEAAAADARAAGHRTSLLTHLDGAPDLESALAAAAGLAGALAAAASAADATVAAAETAEQAGTEAARAAAEAGFADASAARAAWRAPGWRADQQQGIQAEETEAAAVGAQLADPDLDVPLEPPADLDGARETVRLAAESHDEAVSQHSRARDRSATLARLVPQFADALAARQPLRERAEEARQLADLAAGLGANTLRMTLSSFVLAARLEEVAEAASERLLTMTAGRYSLAHTDARRGGGKAGLGLLACDTWTGQERDTSTLSGGETFLASLALALGLADVVTAEAAGVPDRGAVRRRGVRQPRRGHPGRGHERARRAARRRPDGRHRQPRQRTAPAHPRAGPRPQGPGRQHRRTRHALAPARTPAVTTGRCGRDSTLASARVLQHQIADAGERGLDVLAGVAADSTVRLDDRGPLRNLRHPIRYRKQRLRHLVTALGQIIAELGATGSGEVRPERLQLVHQLREHLLHRAVEIARGEAGHCLVGELDRGPGYPGLVRDLLVDQRAAVGEHLWPGVGREQDLLERGCHRYLLLLLPDLGHSGFGTHTPWAVRYVMARRQ